MKTIAALLALAAPMPGSSPAAMDAQEIVRAVLAREAFVHGSGPEPVCVKAAIDDVSLKGWRLSPSRQKRGRRHPVPTATVDWTGVGRPGDPDSGGGKRLSSRKALPITQALGFVLRGPPIPALVRNVAPSWLPRPFEFCRSANQWRRVEISSPAIAGNFAFVDVEYICPICGDGQLFALERSPSGWTIVAELRLWVS